MIQTEPHRLPGAQAPPSPPREGRTKEISQPREDEPNRTIDSFSAFLSTIFFFSSPSQALKCQLDERSGKIVWPHSADRTRCGFRARVSVVLASTEARVRVLDGPA